MTNANTAVIYRVENPDTMAGLWYDGNGKFTEFVRTLDDGQCRDLPMPHDPALAGGWFSACDNLADMSHWFSAADLVQLEGLGYGLYEITVPDLDVRAAGGHVVFRRGNATFRLVPTSLLETEVAAA